MSRKVQKKKQPVKQKQSQRQSQNVVVNVVLAKHRAKSKPSGKKAIPIATPILQPPIRMNVSYGDFFQREQPKREILGEEFRKILAEEISKSKPIAELREDFMSRVESKPKERLIPPPLYDFESGFEEPSIKPVREETPSDLSITEDLFEPRTEGRPPLTRGGSGIRDPFTINYDGATLEMLLSGDYGLTDGKQVRLKPTKRQEKVIEKYKKM